MIQIRRSDERGRGQHGWLDSHHTFSFANYYDPQFMGFGPLRVINEDRVQPGQGFGTHGHRDMEIISYVLEGALAHEDSLGTGSVIRPGDVQRMSAGTGVRHSEFNHSRSEPVHFLQIWIIPEHIGAEPGYEQRSFTEDEKRGRLRLIGSQDGREGSVVIDQDVDLYSALLTNDQSVTHSLAEGRNVWVQVARGAIRIDATGVPGGGEELGAGDGAALSDERSVTVRGVSDAEILLFDMGR